MGQNQKHVKDLKTDRGHGEEIDGDQLLGVILQECAPGLRRRLAAAHHVFADAALTDVDAEFERFAVDARSTPAGIRERIEFCGHGVLGLNGLRIKVRAVQEIAVSI